MAESDGFLVCIVYESSHLLVYDITSLTSFNNLDQYIATVFRLKQMNDIFMVVLKQETNYFSQVLVGTKSDLYSDRKVQTEMAALQAKKHSIKFIEISAKTGSNVTEAISDLCTQILSKKKSKSKDSH